MNFGFVHQQVSGRIKDYDLTGKFVKQWEVPIWTKGVDETPDVVFDEKTKTLYVSSGKANVILAFDVDGNPKTELELRDAEKLSEPGAMAIGEANKQRWLYVVNRGTSTLLRFELPAPPPPAKKK